MTISDRLREWRAYKKLTQKDAATLLGMSYAVYQKYELKSGDNSRKPGAEAIEALVKEGVNANWILTGTGPMLIADYSAELSARQAVATEPPQPVRAATEPSRAAASEATGSSQPTSAVIEPPPCPVDVKRLTEAIESIEGILTRTKRTMRPDAKARAVTLAYQIFEDEDKEKDSASYEYAQKMMQKLIKTMA